MVFLTKLVAEAVFSCYNHVCQEVKSSSYFLFKRVYVGAR
ncbi:hypothetical protein LBKG_01536 [Lactobacillus crispatus CTV-05]|nr:hypothetical protein LBKG_01536 [Lactobacillus crispatus CTV-05]